MSTVDAVGAIERVRSILAGKPGEAVVPHDVRARLRRWLKIDVDRITCDPDGTTRVNAVDVPGWVSATTVRSALEDACSDALAPARASHQTGLVDVILDAARAWDNLPSIQSDPLRDIVLAAASIAPVCEILIPMRVWAVLGLHPVLLKARLEHRYPHLRDISLVTSGGRRKDVCSSAPCPSCGAAPGSALTKEELELLLNVNTAGPILPGSVSIGLVDGELNEVRLSSLAPPRRVRIVRPLWNLK